MFLFFCRLRKRCWPCKMSVLSGSDPFWSAKHLRLRRSTLRASVLASAAWLWRAFPPRLTPSRDTHPPRPPVLPATGVTVGHHIPTPVGFPAGQNPHPLLPMPSTYHKTTTLPAPHPLPPLPPPPRITTAITFPSTTTTRAHPSYTGRERGIERGSGRKRRSGVEGAGGIWHTPTSSPTTFPPAPPPSPSLSSLLLLLLLPPYRSPPPLSPLIKECTEEVEEGW